MTGRDGGAWARYRFGPLERRGLIAGWRGGQIATVSAGLMVGVIALRAHPSIGGAVAALFAVGLSVAAATWPVGGRTVEQWAPDAVRFAAVSARRARIGRASPFSCLRILPVELATTGAVGSRQGRDAAVVFDTATHTYTASFDAWSSGFVLAGPGDKERRVVAWSAVLSSLAREGSVLHRVQWTCRNRPVAGATGYWARGTDPDAAGIAARSGSAQPAGAARSYASLLESEAHDTQVHEVVVSLSIDARKSARAVRSAGGGHSGACALLIREAAALRRRLGEASIESGPLFSPARLDEFVRSSFEEEPRFGGRPKRGSSWPWPMGIRPEWGHVMVEGTLHATYWVSEWPRTEVGADFLGPLLLSRSFALSTSMVMEPMGPIEAARKLENARTADIADAELRRRGGFLATARRRREEQVLANREMELADGHAPFRFSGYVTVRASSVSALEDACSQAEQEAARCGLELRLCYGDQAFAFTATLPLCRGLV